MSETERDARERIDQLLTAAGGSIQDPALARIHAARGVAIRDKSSGQAIRTSEGRPKGLVRRRAGSSFRISVMASPITSSTSIPARESRSHSIARTHFEPKRDVPTQ